MTFISWLVENWKEITGWSIALFGIFSTAVWRFKLWDEKRIAKNTAAAKAKEKLALQIKELQKDLEASDKRVDKLSKLCEKFIDAQGEAKTIASEAKKQSETILRVLKAR